MTRCAVYIRKSREDRDKPSHRLTVQREQLPAHARAQGWSVEVYDDGHASAARGKAEDLKERARLETDVRAGKVDVILTIELSRLSRDETLEDYLAWLNLCSSHGVKLATPSRILDPSQHSDWMLLLMEGGFSSVEMKVLQARMKEGRAEAFRKGKWLGGSPPPPYVYDKATGCPQVDPDQLAKMNRLWKMAETKSTREIAEAFDMPLIAVRRAISDERLLIYQGLREDPQTGELIPCEWKPVMKSDQAERIRQGRRTRRRAPKRVAAGLFSNLALFTCGYCGRTVRAWKNHRTRKDGSRIDYYGCTAKDTRRKCQKSRMFPQMILDERILTNFFGTLERIEDLKAWWKDNDKSDQALDRIADLTAEETALTTQKRRLVAAIAEGVIDFADARQKRNEIEARLGQIRTRRSELAGARRPEPNWKALTISREDFDFLSFQEQREFLAISIQNIRLFSTYLIIEYNFPRAADGRKEARIHLPPPQKPAGTRQVYKA